MGIGAKVQLEREARKMNQHDLCAFVKAKTGYRVTQQTLSKIERDKLKDPEKSVALIKILEALGLTDNGDVPPPTSESKSIRDTPGIDGIHFSAEQRSAIAKRIRERMKHKDVSLSKLGKALGLSADDAYHITEYAAESLPVMVKVCELLSESLNYIALGLSKHDAAPLVGPHAATIAEAIGKAKVKAAKH